MARALDPLNPGPLESSSSRRVLTVSQVNRLVAGMLRERYGDIWVEGEVSGLKAWQSSGHIYFSLKDEDGVLRAVCYKSDAARLKFQLQEGQRLFAHGRLDVYVRQGSYQLVVDSVEPKGIGALQQAFEQLKRKLEKEGLFAEERKRPLPSLPRVIGIVTSPTGAVIQDMLKTLRQYRTPVTVLLYPSLVQGDGAATQIARGLVLLSSRADVDVAIVARGGGSIEDLWAFNEEAVARAIASSRVPVISGVGHQVDYTIADFVADVRAPTPTAAAEMIAKQWEGFRVKVKQEADLLSTVARRCLDLKNQDLDGLITHRAFTVVGAQLSERRRVLEQTVARARYALHDAVRVHRAVLHDAERRMAMRAPQAILGNCRHRAVAAAFRLAAAARSRIDAARRRLAEALDEAAGGGVEAVKGRAARMVMFLDLIQECAVVMLRTYAKRRSGAFESLLTTSPYVDVMRMRAHVSAAETSLGRVCVETVSANREHVNSLLRRAEAAAGANVRDRAGRYDRTHVALTVLSPLASLKRGYSVTLNGAGEVITSIEQVDVRDRVDVWLSDGSLACQVTDRTANVNRQKVKGE